MLRTDGYYLQEPLRIIDGRVKGEKRSYLILAHRFYNDSTVRTDIKHERNQELIDFDRSDFNLERCSKCSYTLTGNIITIENDRPFTQPYDMLIENDTLIHQKSQKKSFFVPWDEVVSGEKKMIHRLFGPLDEGDFEVFYE